MRKTTEDCNDYNDPVFGKLHEYLDGLISNGQKVTPKTHNEFWEKKEDEFWDKRCQADCAKN